MITFLVIATLYPLIGVFCLFSLWVMFVALFSIERVMFEVGIDKKVEQAGKVLLAIGLPFDIFCNIFFATFVFFDIPLELTLSSRIERLANGRSGIRKEMALWFATKAMNPFCRKPHIKIEEQDDN